MEKPVGEFYYRGVGRASVGSKLLGKNADHRPVSFPGMLLFQGAFCHILLGETGYLVSLYINNFILYFMYNFIFSSNFYSNFNIFLRKYLKVSGTPVGSGERLL